MYGAFLREVRTRRGLTQAVLADIVGIDQPNLSAYENDRRTPSLDVFNRLLTACGFEVVAQAGGEEIALPLPVDTGWYPPLLDALPPADPDDPVDDSPAVSRDSSPEARARALVSVVELATAIAPHSPARRR